jgi:hypothetical protein|tara:strand:- start:70 stop:255 length:186 start_codon:yes stop_codon:yes gene_type:complete
MFDLDSKIVALVENYGLELLLEQNEISERLIVEYLLDEKLIDLDDYFNLDAEMAEWKRVEE